MRFANTERLTRVLMTASLVATAVPLVLAALALGPSLLTGAMDGGGGRRRWLFDAYMFFAMTAPVVGVATLAWTVWATRTTAGVTTSERAVTRARWIGGLAVASGALWLFLFPFVFFGTGGIR